MKDHKETLEWLCWKFAKDGERFYPPDETAEECMGAVEELYEERTEMSYREGFGVEKGQHSRAYTTAVEFFVDMKRKAYDPVEMAENEVERSRENGLDLPGIDWEWLEESRYERK